jgi:hypothetical protein
VLKVIVGVSLTAFLTALLGGVLAPWVKGRIDRRREQLDASVELVNVLADALWAYWKMALRVAYYGRQGDEGSEGYQVALQQWHGDDAWDLGADIQKQLSRSKRLLPAASQRRLDNAQREVVEDLDRQVDKLREAGTPAEWQEFYDDLMDEKRRAIDTILTDVTQSLKLGRRRSASLDDSHNSPMQG